MKSNIVYHYCSLDTFNQIISNKTLRVSDITKSNDYEELKWISNSISNTVIKSILNNELLCIKYSIDDTKIQFIKSRIKTTTDSVFVANTRTMLSLACCFSEASDLLSQWRGYANDGNGISIGFDKKTLMSLNSFSFTYNFQKIEYDEKRQKQYIENCITNLIDAYCQVDSKEITKNTFFEFIQDIIARIAVMYNDAPAFKNKCFYEEKEWRICIKTFLSNIVLDDRYTDNSESNIGLPEEEFNYPAKLSNGLIRMPISFSVKGNKLIPYVDLNFDEIKDNFVRKIIIGPKCDVSKLDIQFLLASKGYRFDKIPIIHSACTYR